MVGGVGGGAGRGGAVGREERENARTKAKANEEAE